MIFSIQYKQVFILYTSTFISIIVGVFVSVLNTRSLNPSDFGDFQYVNNTVGLIAGFLLFGYFISGSRLLALSKNEIYSRKIRGIMVCILFVATIILIISLVIIGFVHIFLLKKPTIGYLFFFSTIFCSNTLLINYINTTSQGDNHIIRMSIARLLPSMVYLPIAFLIYRYTGASTLKLLLLTGGIAFCIYFTIIWSTKPLFSDLKSTFKILNIENKTYGLDVYLGSVANVALSCLGSITLGLFNSNNVNVAFFTLALTISSPLSMLPSIIGTVYFKKFANENRISRKVMLGTVGITLLSFIAYLIIIHPVVDLLYDSSYSIVAIYACFLAFGNCLQGFGDMINRFLGSHGKGRAIRNAALISGVILFMGNTLLVYYFGINGAISAKIFGSIGYCITLVYYYKLYSRLINTPA